MKKGLGWSPWVEMRLLSRVPIGALALLIQEMRQRVAHARQLTRRPIVRTVTVSAIGWFILLVILAPAPGEQRLSFFFHLHPNASKMVLLLVGAETPTETV